MHLSVAAFAACAATVHAFKDTSPFVMFSNKACVSAPLGKFVLISNADAVDRLPNSMKDISRAQLQSSTDVLRAAKDFLGACESEKYYIISQPRLTASTLSKSSPHLHEALSHESVKSSLVVPEVVGLKDGDREELVEFVKEKCGAEVSQEFVEAGKYGNRGAVADVWEPMIGGWTESEKKLGQSGWLPSYVLGWRFSLDDAKAVPRRGRRSVWLTEMLYRSSTSI